SRRRGLPPRQGRTMTDLERIAAAIVDEYPGEPEPVRAAEVLEATARADGIPARAVVTWIRDHPRHALTPQSWRSSARRHKTEPATAPAKPGREGSRRARSCAPRNNRATGSSPLPSPPKGRITPS